MPIACTCRGCGCVLGRHTRKLSLCLPCRDAAAMKLQGAKADYSRWVASRDAWAYVHPGDRAFYAAKRRSRALGLPFNLTRAYVRGLFADTTVCPALGIPLAYTKRGESRDNSPSIDRLRPELGYVVGNVVVVSDLANRIKQNANAAQIRAVADWLEHTLASSTVVPFRTTRSRVIE